MGIRFQSIWTSNLSLFTHSNNIQAKVNNFMLYEYNVSTVSDDIHTHPKEGYWKFQGGGGGGGGWGLRGRRGGLFQSYL